MACPHLKYRRESGDCSFVEARAYCTVVERFVQPMRADVCNDRYDLDHERDCEFYRAEHGDVADGQSATTDEGDRA